jgi:hypothetical protein
VKAFVRAEGNIEADIRGECGPGAECCVTGNGLKHIKLLANESDNLEIAWETYRKGRGGV